MNRNKKNEGKKLGDFVGPKQSSARSLRGKCLVNRNFHLGGDLGGRAVLPERDGMGKRRNGGVECGSGSGAVQKWPDAGKKRENVGAGGGLRLWSCRQERGAVGKRMKLTVGPGLSAGEREGKVGVGAGWLARPQLKKREGGAGVGPCRPKEEEGGEKEKFRQFLFQTNFQIHFPIEFLSKLTFCF